MKYLSKKSGFTLIEMLFFIFIFMTVSLAFYKTITTGMQVILETKYRLGALALANEKMEIVRNVAYDDIGTTTGIPNGSFLADEDISINGRQFHVNTFVQYLDDSFDGSFPVDIVPNDYKRVKITVSWSSFSGGTKEVNLVSRFVPPGLEVSAGDGILAINITDGTGVGIPQATVHIVNNTVSPNVNITQETDDNGNLMFPGAEQSELKYQITVSKNGYEMVTTIDPNSVSYNPEDPNASVTPGLLNPKTIKIDLLSDLKIKSINQAGETIPDASFHLEGGRIVGRDTAVVPTEIIYILDSNEVTDSNGEKNINNIGPGQFFVTDIGSISGYTLVGVSPITEFSASPSLYYKFPLLLEGEDKTVEIKFADNNEPGLIVKIMNNADDALINGAEAKLTSAGGYSRTVNTSFDGVAFFPNDSAPLANGEYTLDITAPGFQSYSGTANINNLTNSEVKLTAS